MIIFLNSFCCYFWSWGWSIWVLSGKSSPIFKFKHGWSCFFNSLCHHFWFWGGSSWFYLVNLHQFSSLSMADHVFHQFMSFYWFWGWSCSLEVFVIIFDFYMGVPWSTWKYLGVLLLFCVFECRVPVSTWENLGVLFSTWDYLGVP